MTVRDHLGRSLAVGASALAVLGVAALTMTERALPVAPDATAGTSGVTTTFSSQGAQNNKAIGPLYTAPAAVSTITVPESAQPYLRDVDVRTFITHSASGDMEIELTSPARPGQAARTVRFITGSTNPDVSNPIGGTDDVFNGTLWDDSATTLVTDLKGADLGENAPQASLVPEGALGAFVGIDPRGTWTLTVKDKTDTGIAPPPPAVLSTDGGTLASWNLDLSTQSAAPTLDAVAEFASTGPAIPIQDAAVGNIPGAPATSTITVNGQKNYLADVDIVPNISHTSPGDLTITVSHAGKTAVLATGVDGGTPFLTNKTFNDNGATLIRQANDATTSVIPEGALSVFRGTDPNGVWTISVTDKANLDTGNLIGWKIKVQSAQGGGATTTTPTTPTTTTPPTTTGGTLPPPPVVKVISLNRFALGVNKRSRAVTLNLGLANGSGKVTYTATMSAKAGRKTIRKIVRGSRTAGTATVVKKVVLPKAFAGKRVTVRIVVKNGTTTIIRTKTVKL
ncbi:MAG: proprotein convertase P-domain-containing protein [Thermoleophilia bacterium]